MTPKASLFVALALASCARPPQAELKDVAWLSSTDHLLRAAMALKGTRPTLDELHAVQRDPAQLPVIVDRYLVSREFGETVRDLYNDALLVRAAVRPDLFGFPAVPPLEALGFGVTATTHEASLRLIERVVLEGRPFTEIVTADYLLADRTVATVWGVEYPSAGDGWQVTRYADDRRPAGILSDSALFNRHKSTETNANRGRANLISRALLCYDFATRDVELQGGVDLSTPAAVAKATTDNKACASCHQTLDPLASFFFPHHGLLISGLIAGYPTTLGAPLKVCDLGGEPPCYSFRFYDRAWEGRWREHTGRAPAYFGRPAQHLGDLGRLIADDPRFTLCAARRFAAYLSGAAIDDVPFDTVATLQRVFIDSGLDARSLARAVVLSDAFRASHALADEGADAVQGYIRARPRQLSRLIADLTGYRFEATLPLIGKWDVAADSFYGLEVLGGGYDSYYSTVPAYAVNPTSSLFLRAHAAAAAANVVEADFAVAPAERRLLTLVSDQQTDEAVVRKQLAALHARILGELVEPGALEVDESWLFFSTMLDTHHDVRRAWKATLTALLQDARVIFY